jgi:hypothetical protein
MRKQRPGFRVDRIGWREAAAPTPRTQKGAACAAPSSESRLPNVSSSAAARS